MPFPLPDPVDDDARCVHCDAETSWGNDPAPDLCLNCLAKGLCSPQYGPERAAGYQALVKRLEARLASSE